MNGKQHAVLWLGIILIGVRLFTTKQWSDIWGGISNGSVLPGIGSGAFAPGLGPTPNGGGLQPNGAPKARPNTNPFGPGGTKNHQVINGVRLSVA